MNTHLTQTKSALYIAPYTRFFFTSWKDEYLKLSREKKIHAFIPCFIEKPLIIYF